LNYNAHLLNQHTIHELHWLPVQQRITLAVLTYKVRSTSTVVVVYRRRRITERIRSWTLRSPAIPLLQSKRSPRQTFPGVLSAVL